MNQCFFISGERRESNMNTDLHGCDDSEDRSLRQKQLATVQMEFAARACMV